MKCSSQLNAGAVDVKQCEHFLAAEQKKRAEGEAREETATTQTKQCVASLDAGKHVQSRLKCDIMKCSSQLNAGAVDVKQCEHFLAAEQKKRAEGEAREETATKQTKQCVDSLEAGKHVQSRLKCDIMKCSSQLNAGAVDVKQCEHFLAAEQKKRAEGEAREETATKQTKQCVASLDAGKHVQSRLKCDIMKCSSQLNARAVDVKQCEHSLAEAQEMKNEALIREIRLASSLTDLRTTADFLSRRMRSCVSELGHRAEEAEKTEAELHRRVKSLRDKDLKTLHHGLHWMWRADKAGKDADDLRKALDDTIAELKKQDASEARETVLAFFGLLVGALTSS